MSRDNKAYYQSLAIAAANRYGIDPDEFSRQISVESGFNPGARSPAGALGIAQIMPATARGWGVDPMDPAAALDAAARAMAGYKRAYGPVGALVAYNAGPGRAEEFLKTGWTGLARLLGNDINQTRSYVEKISMGSDTGPGSGPESGGRPSRALAMMQGFGAPPKPDVNSVLQSAGISQTPTGRSVDEALDLLQRARVPDSAFNIDPKQAVEILARADIMANGEELTPSKINDISEAYKMREKDPLTLKMMAVSRLLAMPPSQRNAIAPSIGKEVTDIEFKAMALAHSPFKQDEIVPTSRDSYDETLKKMGMTEQSLLNELNWPVASTGYGVPSLEELYQMQKDLSEVEGTLTAKAMAAYGDTEPGQFGNSKPAILDVIHQVVAKDRARVDGMISEVTKAKTPAAVQALQWKYATAKDAMNKGLLQNYNQALREGGMGGLQFFNGNQSISLDTMYEWAIRQDMADDTNALTSRQLDITERMGQANLQESVLKRLQDADNALFNFVLQGGLGMANAKIAQRNRVQDAASKGLVAPASAEFVPGFEPGGLLESTGRDVGVPVPNLRLADYSVPIDENKDAMDIQSALEAAAKYLPQFRQNPAAPVQAPTPTIPSLSPPEGML